MRHTGMTVSELSRAEEDVEDSYGFVRVRGRSPATRAAFSGHNYFALKDEGAKSTP